MSGDWLAMGAMAALAAAAAARGSRAKPVPFSDVVELQRLALVRAEHFSPRRLRGLDLFAGAGGFTIGALQQGCPVIGIEYGERPVQTGQAAGHDVLRMDVAEAARREPALSMDVMLGGPPCQPFSRAGKRKGRYDPREGFGLTIDAIDAWHPTRVVLENVSDFLSPDYKVYRDSVFRSLGQRYAHVGVWLLNAKHYGVPQDRQRVFIWAAEQPLVPPPITHGPGTGKPYVTIHEALPHLVHEGYEALLAFQTGATARSSGQPSPTVTTQRNLYAVTDKGLTYRGGGTVPASKRKILYPVETAALQAFPATFGFVGNLEEQQRQIGNAVPPPLAAAVVAAVTVGLKPHRIHSSELLDTFKRLDDSIWLYEPRPWTDQALIGITTMKSGAEGQIVPVYDSTKLKSAVFDAYERDHTEETGKPLSRFTDDDHEEVFNAAMSYLTASKASHHNPAAPVIVPTKTLEAFGLPIATMLLSEQDRDALLLEATRRMRTDLAPDEIDEDVVWDTLLETISEYDEIWEF